MEEYSLCKLCARLLVCDRAKEQNQKVYYCEDFQKSENASERHKTIGTDNNPKHRVNNMQNGLCRICENRDICNIQIPNGGLWHCENFL
jgi:hypothetical protein